LVIKNEFNDDCRLDQRVVKVNEAKDIHVLPSIEVAGGESPVTAKRAVVVATDGPAVSEILDMNLLSRGPLKEGPPVGTCCLYFRWITRCA